MCGKGSQTTTTTSTPNPQALQAYSNLLNQAGNVASTPFQPYTGEFVAPVNQQQQLAGGNINQYSGFAQPYIQQAAGYATQAAQPISASNINQYLSPYTQDVVNATQAQFNNQNQQQLENVRGNAAAQGALGGDREGIAEANLSNQQNLAQAPVIAGLENQGYNTALSTALQEQQNLGQSAYSLGNLGVAGQNAGLTGANAQLGYGTLQQSTQQAQDTALYNQFLAQQGYPFQTTQWLAGIDTGVGSQMGGTGTTTGPPPNPWSSILGLGALGLGAWNASDERVKDDIQKVGKTDDGQNLYRWRYKASPEWHIGPIAQEVEKKHPEAVAGFGGVKYVDLKRATDDAVERRDGGKIPGFQMGGTPYSSLGGTSYIPTMGLTMGPGAPKSGGQVAQQPNPLQQASQIMQMEKGFGGSGKSGFSNLFGNSDVSIDEATQAGAEAGLSPEELGFGAGGEDLLLRSGGSVRGFDDGGGLAADLGINDIGSDQSFGGPTGSGTDPDTERRSAALAGLLRSGDIVPPSGQGMSLGDLVQKTAPGFENNFGIDDSRASWNEAIRQGGDRYQAAANQPPLAPDVVHTPSDDAGRVYNLTDDANAAGGARAPDLPPPTLAPDLPPPIDVADTRPKGLDVSSYAPVPGSAGAPAVPSGGEGEKQAGFGGLLSSLFSGAGRNPQLGRALMTAGFAMMASRSPFLANAVGEGGLAGLSSYSGETKQQASIEDARKKLEQHADEFAKKLALDTKKLQQSQDYQQQHLEYLKQHSKELLEQGKFSPPMPGTGKNAAGETVPGAWVTNTKTGEPIFHPNMVLTPKGGAAAESTMDPVTLRRTAAMYNLIGGAALTNVGRGAQGSADVMAIRKEAARQDEEAGVTPEQRANKQAEYQGNKAAQRTLANMEVKMGSAGVEALGAIQLLRPIVDRVPRTSFLPLNKLIEGWQNQTLNADQAELLARIQGVRNTYATVMQRGANVNTVAAQHRADELLNTAADATVLNRTLDTMESEINMAANSPDQMRKFYESRYGGQAVGPMSDFVKQQGAINAGGGASAVPPAGQRQTGQVYQTPKGPFRWNGSGWDKP